MRNSRGFGRLLAAWLLLWFIAMAALPVASPAAGQGAVVASAPAGDPHERCTPAGGEPDTAGAGHAAHATHATHAAPATDGAQAHGGHAPGSPVHCPFCLHAAAPPFAWPAQPALSEAPGLPVAARGAPAARVRSDAPAPGRGPPSFS